VASGLFHEALTLAALWRAPVVFVIENNRYAEFTDSEAMWRGAPLVERALAYGLAGAEQVDGNDVQAVRAVAARAVATCRAGEGPWLVEALTYRHHGHYEGDPARYREEGELEEWRERDPLSLARRALAADGRDEDAARVIAAAEDEMERAVQEGLAAPYPDVGVVLEDVHA
jgi:TPP-dependent pyruvate/acetoin dehydrogenase alpha subunit